MVLLAVTVVLSGCACKPDQTSRTSRKTDTLTSLCDPETTVAAKIQLLREADPTEDARRALAQKDPRFLDITGYDAIPGVKHWNARLKATHGTRIIGDSFGMVINDEDASFRRLLRTYAEQYNTALLAALGEGETDPGALHQSVASKVEALIERLAISQEEAGTAPVFTPAKDTPSSDKRMAAYDAAKEIRSYGRSAFPLLLKHMDDRRQSVAFRSVLPSTVADACFCIIRGQVESVPGAWRGHQRKGPNGQYVQRPVFLTRPTIRRWYDKREDWALVQMQMEAVEALLAAERKAGFADKKQEEEIVAPYLARLQELRRRRPEE